MEIGQSLRAAAVTVAAATLVGCGGGGGGGGGGSAPANPPAAVDGRATLTAANTERAVATAVWALALPLTLVRQLNEDLLALHDERLAEVTTVCSGVQPGRVERRWTDADANRRLSPGDSVEWRIVRCNREAWNGDAEATALVRVRLTRVGASANFGVAGTVEFAEPLVAPNLLEAPAGARLSGSFDFEAQRTATTIELRASSSARDDLRVDVPGNTESHSLRGFAVSKLVSMSSARIEWTARGTLDSSDLGGPVEVSTPTPLRAFLDTVPERHAGQGQVVLRGRANAQVRLGAGPGDGRQWSAEFDADGDGGSDAVVAGPWGTPEGILTLRARKDGFIFHDPRSRALAELRAFDAADLRIAPIYHREGALRAGQVFQVQFNRPIQAASFPTTLLLNEVDCSGYGVGERRVQAYALAIDGALVTLTPPQPFKWCSTVDLRSASGVPSGSVLAAAGGGSVPASALTNQGAFIQPVLLASPQSDRTLLTDSQPLTLDARVSGDIVRAERWQWSRVSGPEVVFSAPQAATTTLQLAPGASGAAPLRVRLTVENILGEASTRDLLIDTLVPHPNARFAVVRLGIQGQSRDQLFADGPDGALSVSGSGPALSANWIRNGNFFTSFNLNLLFELTVPLVPGRYPLPVPGGWPQLTLGGNDVVVPCRGSGELTIHALRRDADGGIVELALDAVRDCGAPLLQAVSLRLNSAHPLPAPP
jgi:hypothetical protein